MRISLDFDGVISNTMQSWLDKWNHDHHSTLCYNDINQWHFNKTLGISSDVFFDYLKKSWEDWETLRPMESNLNIKINELIETNNIDIVTSVLPSHITYVEKWLKRWEIPYDKIVNAIDKISLDYELYIDDRPGLFEDLQKHNIRNTGEPIKYGILYHQPWNAYLKLNSIMTQERVYNWKTILGVVNEY